MKFLWSLLLTLACINIYSQVQINGEEIRPTEEYNTLDDLFESYSIYRIDDLDRSKFEEIGSSFIFNIKLGNKAFKLSMYKDNIRLLYDAPNKPFALGGSLNSGELASLTVNEDFIFGFITQGQSTYYIEPLHRLVRNAPGNYFIFYNVNSIKNDGTHKCGADLVASKTPKEDNLNYKMPTTMCKIVDYAIANTYDMVTALGNATNVMNFNTGVLNDVQTNYRSEFDANLEYDVVVNYIPTSSAGNPYDPPTSSTNGSTLLANFREWARGPGNAGGGNSGGATGGFGVDYTMAGLWTDTNFSGGVVGIAYTPGWHHILENYTDAAFSLKTMVTHEIGHNWNCLHDGGGTFFIMAPSVRLTNQWSPASKTSINNRVSAQNYLADCSTIGSPVANFAQRSIAICTNEDLEFEDQSQYGATRDWSFTNGTPASSTSEKPLISYTMAGLHSFELIADNTAGSDTTMGYVDIKSAAPPTPCTPTGTGGSTEIEFFTLGPISHESSGTDVYEDFSCSISGTFEESTEYEMSIGLRITSGGTYRYRYFADFNNDGDFTDTGESSGTYQFTVNYPSPPPAFIIVPVNFAPITMPASPVTEELIRLRIIASAGTIGSGCTTPSNGQVEDYSMYFDVAQVFGCTDPTANNYDPNATVDDGSCTYGLQTWYEDADSDTYGNPNVSQQSASQPMGYVLDNTDCDDTDALEFPGQTWYKDNDADTYSDGVTLVQCTRPTNYFVAAELNGLTNDCDDDDATAFPGNPEVCDGVDNDCDGSIDEGVQTTFYQDFDGDGFGNPNVSTLACSAPMGFVSNNTDCNDSDALEFPGQVWFKDLDGDQYGDGTSITQCTRPIDYYDSTELISVDLDCDDNNANAFPGNPEVCDGADNDCDGNIDEGLPLNTYYLDSDGDTYGDANVSTTACSAPAGYVTDNTDCDDSDSAINPGATELCDGVDNNCDGTVDEGCSTPPDCDGVNLFISNVTQAEYGAEISLASDAVVDFGSSVLFAAGSVIDLEAGFEVVPGQVFEAIISPCATNIDNPDNDESSSSRAVEDKELESIKNQMLESFGPDQQVQFKVLNRWGEQEYSQQSNLQDIDNNGLDKLRQKLEPGQYMVILKVGDESRRFIFTVTDK